MIPQRNRFWYIPSRVKAQSRQCWIVVVIILLVGLATRPIEFSALRYNGEQLSAQRYILPLKVSESKEIPHGLSSQLTITQPTAPETIPQLAKAMEHSPSVANTPSEHEIDLKSAIVLRTCDIEELSKGRWYENETINQRRFLCCGWDPDAANYAPQTAGCMAGADFVQSVVGARGCTCKGEEHKYQWAPDGCDLAPFDGPTFCASLQNHTLFIVGDSIVQEMYGTLVGMVDSSGGKCLHQLKYGLSDNLVGGPWGMARGRPLAEYVQKERALGNKLIVVTGVGAHIPEMTAFMTIVKQCQEFMLSNHVPFLWLTPTPGHPNCLQQHAPLNMNASLSTEQVFQHVFRFGSNYNWHSFQSFSNAALTTFGPERTLDIFQPLLPRIDGHTTVECLHYCIGALEIVPLFLNHILLTMPSVLIPP